MAEFELRATPMADVVAAETIRVEGEADMADAAGEAGTPDTLDTPDVACAPPPPEAPMPQPFSTDAGTRPHMCLHLAPTVEILLVRLIFSKLFRRLLRADVAPPGDAPLNPLVSDQA